jgi:hypothetical protein
MLKFKKFFRLSEGFGEGGDIPIGALSKPAIKSKKQNVKAESGSTFSRSDFISWHAESGGPKFNKRSEHGGYSFYAKHEK